MERMRFTCSAKIEMPSLATWIVLANCHLDLQAKDTRVRSTGLPLPSKGRGEGEGYDLLRQTTSFTLEPFTSRLRSATAWQAVLSPSKGTGGGTRNMNQVRMDLTK